MTRIAVSALMVMMLLGCTRDIVDADRCNLTVIISDEFAKSKSDYSWWPSNEKNGNGGNINFGNINFGSGGKDAAVALAVVVAVALVYVTADVTVHNINGVDLALVIDGGKANVTIPLKFGETRHLLSQDILDGLKNGSVLLKVVGSGTRKFSIEVPTKDVDFGNDINYLEFTPAGKVVVNGKRM